VHFAAELRILLVYLSESLGRLGQNEGGDTGGHIFHWGAPPAPPPPPPPPPPPRRTAPVTNQPDTDCAPALLCENLITITLCFTALSVLVSVKNINFT